MLATVVVSLLMVAVVNTSSKAECILRDRRRSVYARVFGVLGLCGGMPFSVEIRVR